MVQGTHELRITKVVHKDTREPHDETIYFTYFGHDLRSESFKDLLADVYANRCVTATTLYEAFHPSQATRFRLKQKEVWGQSSNEPIGERRIYQVNFSMAASKITQVEETWEEEQLSDEVD